MYRPYVRNWVSPRSYFNFNSNRDFNILTDFSYKGNLILDYKSDVELELKAQDKRLTLNAQINKVKIHFAKTDDMIKNIPGKHLLVLINDLLKLNNLIHQYSLESLTYKLAKEVDSENFKELKFEIDSYMIS